MNKTVYRLLQYWKWHKEVKPDATFESFMDYLCNQNDKGGGL